MRPLRPSPPPLCNSSKWRARSKLRSVVAYPCGCLCLFPFASHVCVWPSVCLPVCVCFPARTTHLPAEACSFQEEKVVLPKAKKSMTKTRAAELVFEEMLEIAESCQRSPNMFDAAFDLGFDYLANLSGATVEQLADR